MKPLIHDTEIQSEGEREENEGVGRYGECVCVWGGV